KLILQSGKLTFLRTRTTVQEFCHTSQDGFDRPETWEIQVPIENDPEIGAHQVMTQNFVNAILNDEPLLSPGTEGAKGLEMGNAILLSGLTGKPVEFPIDADAYAEMLQSLIRNSTFQKEVNKVSGDDFAKSFHS
ncbi:gfo/Idh/MocA family oxidoreductase, partial [bacterium]|nr:gfo/Idh/MocA family oxidoreductase [bacterium]